MMIHFIFMCPVFEVCFFLGVWFLFIFSELWWRYEASSQQHGCRNARSEHVGLLFVYIVLCFQLKRKINHSFCHLGALGQVDHGPILTMPTL